MVINVKCLWEGNDAVAADLEVLLQLDFVHTDKQILAGVS
jgi:hypothetical protein